MISRTNLLKFLKTFYFFSTFLFLFTINVSAYVDPSVMTYAIQAIAGLAITLGTVATVYWRKISKIFFHGSNKSAQTLEVTELEFHDPVTHQSKTISESHPAETNKQKSDFPTAILLSFAISFMLVFYTPLQLYLNNIYEFDYDIYAILPYICFLFVITFLILLLLYYIVFTLSKKGFFILIVLGLFFYLTLYVQGNLLIKNLPVADGSPVDWSMYSHEMTQSMLLWISSGILCILLAIFLKKNRFCQLTKVISICLTSILFITLIFISVSNNGFKKKDQLCVSNTGLNVMSSDRNFVIFIVDAVDSSVFNNLLNSSNPEYREIFKDFTYYPDTLGAYPHTQLGVPQLLTGQWYECEEDYRTYFTNAINKSPFLNTLKEKDYSIGIYDTDLVSDDPSIYDLENIENIPFRFYDPKDFILDELRMVFYLYAPYQLKKYEPYAIYNLQNERPAGEFYYWYNGTVNGFFLENEFSSVSEKKFREIHIEGGHVPFKYDADANYIGEDNGTYEMNIQASVTVLKHYLQKLKQNNTYDNTAIVILADHGFENRDTVEGRQNPLLLIKGVNESHEFAVSDKPLSYNDLPEIYQNLLNGKTEAEITPDHKEKDVRRYIEYAVYHPDHLVEYELTNGKANDYNALHPTGRTFDYADSNIK